MKKGCVYLVGAGPGDPGLMTMKGKQVLARADVVVYDRLVGAGVLALIPAGAKRINVGKRSACHPVPQDEINRILLREAQSGACVVRLKGGDPFVFGRGGEELELLRENGVPFEVVPGITSAVAAAAYAGIPVTHRDFCSSVHIITGHARENGELHLDYEALVRLNGTLVFLMSVATVRAIAAGLLAAGMDSAMPAALVENGTRGDQRKLIAPLRTVADEAERQHIASPAVFLVGRVCALSQDFDWFSAKPLKGARVLVTQPAQKASAFADLLTERGAAVTLLPCIRICPREAPPLALEGIDAVLFTSAPGVETFFAALQREGRDARALAGRIVACVGQKTAAEAARFGIRADFVPTTADGAHLAEELLQSGLLRAGARVLLARAAAGGEELPALLRAGGMAVTDLALYDTQLLPPRERPSPADFDFITFTSASCVEGFAGAACGPGGNAFAPAAAAPEVGQMFGAGGAAESSAAERFSIPRAAESSAAEHLSAPGAASSAPAEPHSSKAPAPVFSRWHAVCIGETTAAAARRFGFHTTTAAKADLDSMAVCMEAAWHSTRKEEQQ